MTFEILWKDEVVAKIDYNQLSKKIVGQELNQEVPLYKRPFGLTTKINNSDLEEYLSDRHLPRGRGGLDNILSINNLSSYNTLDIIKKTHGTMFEDCFWIRFEEENLAYEDVKIR